MPGDATCFFSTRDIGMFLLSPIPYTSQPWKANLVVVCRKPDVKFMLPAKTLSTVMPH